MRMFQVLLMRVRALVRAEAVDRELAEEMREHLDRLTQEHVARGMTPAAALEAARREFGPVAQLVEESRDARGVMSIVNGWQDVRYGVRLMLRAPGFTAAAVLTVALGMVAAAATARVLGSLRFNVSGFDALSVAASTAILFLVALAACGVPARRAAGVDPSLALRAE